MLSAAGDASGAAARKAVEAAARRWAGAAVERAQRWAVDSRRADEWAQASEMGESPSSPLYGIAPLRGRLKARRRRVLGWAARLATDVKHDRPAGEQRQSAEMVSRAVEELGAPAHRVLVGSAARPPLDDLAVVRRAVIAPAGSRLARQLAADRKLAEAAAGVQSEMSVRAVADTAAALLAARAALGEDCAGAVDWGEAAGRLASHALRLEELVFPPTTQVPLFDPAATTSMSSTGAE